MHKRTIKDLNEKEVIGKRILVRVDFNVPLNEELEITNDTRIKAALPTIKYLISHQVKVILMSHLGRPKGKVIEKLRLNPVAKRLSELLGKEVKKYNDCIGEEVEKAVLDMQNGEVILLENLRFHPEEEKNDQQFSKRLAKLGELFVNDAFATAHRAHASTVGVAHILPSCAGFLMAKEIEVLSNLLENPERPFVVVLGGAKISGKIEVVQNLLNIADKILIAGGMCYTCLAALGYEVTNLLLEEYDLEIVKKMLKKAEEQGNKIILPVDLVITKELSEKVESKVVEIENVPKDVIGADIGDKSIAIFEKEIKKAIFVLLENAFTYTKENGFVKIKSYQTKNSIVTSISDNGPGIDKDIEKKMFQRYAMIKIIERKIGSGLGLYLTKLIIDAHNGKLWYKTQRGKGTTFYFSLPIFTSS